MAGRLNCNGSLCFLDVVPVRMGVKLIKLYAYVRVHHHQINNNLRNGNDQQNELQFADLM